ncbi:MAG: PadR family transcriptional regulator [Anaerolineae bacterium]
MLKYTLLGFLSYMSLTGYELESYMAETTAYFWHAKLSQIYATLKKLEEERSWSHRMSSRRKIARTAASTTSQRTRGFASVAGAAAD